MISKRTWPQRKVGSAAAGLLLMFLGAGMREAAAEERSDASKQKASFSVSTGVFVPSESRYREIYGTQAFYSDVKGSYAVRGGFFVWGGTTFSPAEGMIAEIGEGAKASTRILSFGAGYGNRVGPKLEFRIDGGICHARMKEKAMGLEMSLGRVGWVLDAGLMHPITNRLYAGVTAGYVNAGATVRDERIKLGGVKAGVVLAYRF